VSTETYRGAGVDAAACEAWLASLGARLPAIGGFGGLWPLGDRLTGMREPCLVAAADGVGTKVLVARAAGDFSSVGIDCVAMVVNDLICCGAQPMFFLDYLAMGRFDAAQADAVLEGLRRGCEIAGAELLGGETAELPGLIPRGDFDVCGFAVGAVDRARVIDGAAIREGDLVVGLPSTGLHANGFSLARRVLPEFETDADLARQLLTPTAIHVEAVLGLLARVRVRGIAHITGGGLPHNLARILPSAVDAHLNPARWSRPAIFNRIAQRGGIGDAEMCRTFNMGIGLCLVIEPRDLDQTLRCLQTEQPAVIGEITAGSGAVRIEGMDADA
jgi:phosphoribosylformylglycinamidine cyclo-ligase